MAITNSIMKKIICAGSPKASAINPNAAANNVNKPINVLATET
jgi:hypothetical protein